MTEKKLILSEDQLNNILNWFPNNDQQKQDEKVLEYLREASAEMKSKWPENNQKKIEENLMKNPSPRKIRFEMMKNADENKRRELIEEAVKFVTSRKIKECPIDLRSAAILSENLASRKIQLEFQAKQREEEKAKNLIKNQEHMAQSIAWLKDGFEHRTNAYRVALEHKQELYKQIADRKYQRDTEKSLRISEEQKAIEIHEKNIEEQKVRERKAKEEQNEYMRKHEIETVLMAKQKRDRIKRENEVVAVLAKVHEEGKKNIREMIKNQENLSKFERIQLATKLAEQAKIRHFEEIEKLKKEQQDIEKARIEKEKILDEKEIKAKEHKDFLKYDRKQDYEKSLITAAERRAAQKEEDKEYFKNRLMNDVVSRDYTRMKKECQARKTWQNLDFLKQQAKEVRQINKDERDKGMKDFNQQLIDDKKHDHKFFDYANDLLEDAANKHRPIKPIVQVIKKYKNLHFIDVEKKLRPHEISNVPIEEEIQKIKEGSNRGKSKRMLKYEKDEELLKNVYRSTKFLNIDKK